MLASWIVHKLNNLHRNCSTSLQEQKKSSISKYSNTSTEQALYILLMPNCIMKVFMVKRKIAGLFSLLKPQK